MALKAKEKNKMKLLEYLGNPDNDWPTRTFLSQKVLGYKQAMQINKVFTPEELQQIEQAAIQERRKKYARFTPGVDHNLIKKAQESDNPKWAELYYERIEGWKRTQKLDHSSSDGTMTPITIEVYPGE